MSTPMGIRSPAHLQRLAVSGRWVGLRSAGSARAGAADMAAISPWCAHASRNPMHAQSPGHDAGEPQAPSAQEQLLLEGLSQAAMLEVAWSGAQLLRGTAVSLKMLLLLLHAIRLMPAWRTLVTHALVKG